MVATQQPLRAGIYARQSRGKVKSIAEQDTVCADDAAAQGWDVVARYADTTSASRYATRARADHGRLLADIAAAQLDVVATWSPDRADRTLTTWSAFLDACREGRVLIRITDHERTYNVNNPRDWRQLAEDGIDAAYFSEKLSRAVLRGVTGAATTGRPPMGPCPYGYRRVYDPATGKLTGQEPDPATAPIVREIFDRIARSEPLSAIARDLNIRHVPPPGTLSHRTGSQRWYRQRLRVLAGSVAYIGRRKHHSETHTASWPALVEPETFYAAARVLGEPGRMVTARPGRQRYLLTYLGQCHRGHPLTARDVSYVCRTGCVRVSRQALDELVEAAVVEALATPKIYRRLRRAGELTDREVQAARNKIAELEEQLVDWRRSATDGRGTTPATLATVEADLARQIEAARERADRAGLPPALRPFVEPGADVEARWCAATLPAKRAVIRALMAVTVRPCPGRNPHTPVADRVDIEPMRP